MTEDGNSGNNNVTPITDGQGEQGPLQYAGEDEPVTNGSPDHYEGNESHSIGAAEAAGGVAVGDVSVQPAPDSVELVPKNILHVPGVNSAEGDSPYVDPESPTTEHDVNKAFEDATVGHELHSDAADSRRTNLSNAELQSKHREVIADPRYLKPRRPWRRTPEISSWGNDQTRQELGEWRASNREDGDPWPDATELLGEVDGINRYNRAHPPSEETKEFYARKNERRQRYHIERAREKDQQAKALIEWTELVGKISDEYKAAHPEFGFGVEEMMAIEAAVKDDESYVPWRTRELEYELTVFDDGKNLSLDNVLESIDDTIEMIYEADGETEANGNIVKRYSDILKDQKEASLRKLLAFYKELKNSQITRLKAEAEQRKTVLEDVKTGRASQPPEPTEGQLAA